MGNYFLPNTFQKPNFVTDHLLFYLTPEEYVVLDILIREILGWQERIGERKAPISRDVICNGKWSRDGKRQLTRGCGLNVNTVKAALVTLEKYQIVRRLGEKPTPQGWVYWLQDDSDKIDWDGLETRKTGRKAKNASRTVAASLAKITGGSSDDPPVKGIVGRSPGGSSDDPPLDRGTIPPTSYLETQRETHIETQSYPSPFGEAANGSSIGEKESETKGIAAAAAGGRRRAAPKTPVPAAVRVWHTAIGRYPKRDQYPMVNERLGDAAREDVLRHVYSIWRARDYKPTNVDGISRWYRLAMASHDPLAWEGPPQGNGRSFEADSLSDSISGEELWDTAVGPAMDKNGYNWRPQFGDAAVQEAVEAIGWNVLCRLPEVEAKRAFAAEYKKSRAARDEMAEMPAPLRSALDDMLTKVMR